MKRINGEGFKGLIPLDRNQMRSIRGGMAENPSNPNPGNYTQCTPQCQTEADAAALASAGSGIPGIWAMTYASCMSACLTAAQT